MAFCGIDVFSTIEVNLLLVIPMDNLLFILSEPNSKIVALLTSLGVFNQYDIDKPSFPVTGIEFTFKYSLLSKL